MSKQIILVRQDLNMPAGKMAAQVAHASMAALLSDFSKIMHLGKLTVHAEFNMTTDSAKIDWLCNSFTKVVVSVSDEQEMRSLIEIAKQKDLPTSFIVDEGRTVFNGVKTPTCAAIGPGCPELIDSICRKLPLYT